MVFQIPTTNIVATIVEEEVAFGLENTGVDPEEMRRRVDEALLMSECLNTKTMRPISCRVARSKESP
jgi:energy-coupling factor transport system ATP-binding protein